MEKARSARPVCSLVFDTFMEIVYHLSVSAKLAEEYDMYEPATAGAVKTENRLTKERRR